MAKHPPLLTESVRPLILARGKKSFKKSNDTLSNKEEGNNRKGGCENKVSVWRA